MTPRARLARALGLALLLSTIPAAFGADAGGAGAGTIGIRLAFDPPTLDWNLGDVPIHVMNNAIEGLYSVSVDGRLVANEAQGWPRKTGPATWRIRLRPGLKWSDGRPVTASDYVFSWRRLLDPKTGSTYASLLFGLEGAQAFNAGKAAAWRGALAVSDRELELRLSATAFPTAVFTHWTTFPVRGDLVGRFGADWARPENLVFNGPYKITLYQPDTKIELAPNPRHRQPGSVTRIEALIVGDDATALRLYETGRLHFLSDLNTLDRKTLAGRPDFRSIASPVLVYVGIDPRHPELSSPAARKALGLAVARSEIPKILASSHRPVSRLSPGLLRAGQERAAGGHDEPGARGGPGGPLSGKTLVFAYFEKGSNRTLAEFLQAQWKNRLDLKTELLGSEIKSYWSRLAEKPYPLFLNSYGPPVWDTRYYFELLRSANPMNMGRWANPAYDRAVERRDWAAAARILDAEAPIVPLYLRSYDYLMSPRLKGAPLNPMTSLDLGQARLLER